MQQLRPKEVYFQQEMLHQTTISTANVQDSLAALSLNNFCHLPVSLQTNSDSDQKPYCLDQALISVLQALNPFISRGS